MPILDEPSDERSPLKEDVEINTTSSAALATAESAPPPYTLIPTPSPNPIPPTDLHDLVIFLTQWSTIRRILVTWVVFLLVMVLWSAFVYSTSKTRHLLPIGREYEVVRLHSIHSFMPLN
jgi:hypothetical protein